MQHMIHDFGRGSDMPTSERTLAAMTDGGGEDSIGLYGKLYGLVVGHPVYSSNR